MSHVLLLEMDCNARTRVTQNREIFIDGQRSFTPGNENPNKPSDVFTAEGHWFQKILDDECPSIGLMPSIGDKNALLNKIRQKMGGDPQLQNQSLDTAKKKCADLGFKSGTEDFGKCVLKLSK